MKKTIITLLTLLLAISFVWASGSKENVDSLEYVKEKGTFILGLDDSFPPMGYRDENNEIVGFDIDLAKEVCKRLGLELVLQPIDWNAKEQELSTKQIDCIWNGFTVTEERLKEMTFSIPYLNNGQVVVVKASSNVKSLNDLAGKTIGVQAGSSAQDAINDTPEFKSIIGKTVDFDDNLTALMDLDIGGCDAVVMDLMVANYAIGNSNIKCRLLDEMLATEQYAIGFRLNDTTLAEAVNNALLEMAKDGTMAKISTDWFGADITIVGK